MRDALEHLAEMESYILGTHPDRPAFEQRLQTDTTLRQDLNRIQQLVGAIRAQGIKQEILRARTNRVLNRWLKGLGIAAVLLTAAMTAVVAYNTYTRKTAPTNDTEIENTVSTTLPPFNETGGNDWAQADSVLPTHTYTLDAAEDMAVETPSGIIFSIPKGSFTDKNGTPVTGSYQLEVKEAMHPADIMKAGLSTWSDDKLLETGGMFYINARQDGENLQPAKGADITASVPKMQNRDDMMLFDGVRVSKQIKSNMLDSVQYDTISDEMEINWINPRPPVNELLAVPMQILNFYPPGFEKTLVETGYPNDARTFKDSVYLSFLKDSYGGQNEGIWVGETLFRNNCSRCHTTGNNTTIGSGLAGVGSRWPSKEKLVAWVINPMAVLKNGDKYAAQILKDHGSESMPSFPHLSASDVGAILDYIDASSSGIDPSAVLAFWNKDFDGTILATREFERRMRAIHGTCNQRVLECYTQNMDKPLYHCDSLAMRAGGGSAFYDFFAQRLTRPADPKRINQALLQLLAKKQRELDAAYNRTTGAWMRQQAEADQTARTEAIKQDDRNANREAFNFQKEYQENLCAAKRQLGEPCNDYVTRPSVRDNYNTFAIQTTGWKNVDAYAWTATQNRESMAFTDPITGKKAAITYETVTLNVAETGGYDIIEAYIIPWFSMSFMRMDKNGGTFTKKLSTSSPWSHMVVVGFRGDEIFLYTQESITFGTTEVRLAASTRTTLAQFINKNASQRTVDDFGYELQNLTHRVSEAKRSAQKLARENLRAALMPVVYPCDSAPQPTQEPALDATKNETEGEDLDTSGAGIAIFPPH